MSSMLFASCGRRFVGSNSSRILSSSCSSSARINHLHHNYIFSKPSVVEIAKRTMITIAEGVEFDTIAREWRCKWSSDNDKASLVAAQKALNEVLPKLKIVDGVLKVDRIVCGGCLDFKIITRLPAGGNFSAWEAAEFSPEKEFLEKLRSIPGISAVETQTYTIMPVL